MKPIAKVYQINNGYLLGIEHDDPIVGSTPDMTYAADAQGLGEAIIAAAARKKLDIPQPVPTQQEMFTSAQMGATKGVS
tara:strand:+ start:501 stop:737 length:237 start_codon:yes stop_codon:yes gene_type:complete